jgi:hypothetical protein
MDAWFELLGGGDSRSGLLDDCRPDKMAAVISALAADSCLYAFYSLGRSYWVSGNECR